MSSLRRIVGSSVVIVAAGALVAAAGASTPTRATWAAAANAVCRVENAKIRQLPKLTSRKLFIDDLRATVRVAREGDAGLAAIPRPASERAAIQSFLANSEDENTLIVRQLLPAVLRGDDSAIQSASSRLGRLGSRYNAMARALGARVCAVNPQPSG